MRKLFVAYGPVHIAFLVVLSVALGMLAAGCQPKGEGKPQCSATATGKDCPVQGPYPQG